MRNKWDNHQVIPQSYPQIVSNLKWWFSVNLTVSLSLCNAIRKIRRQGPRSSRDKCVQDRLDQQTQ